MYQSIYYEREQNRIHLWDDALGYRFFRYNNTVYEPVDYHTGLKTIYGQNVKAVRNRYEDDYLLERDVNPEIKTLIQQYKDYDNIPSPLNIGFIDIEVDSIGGWKRIRNFENELLSISLRDYNLKKTFQFVVDKNNRFTLKNDESKLFCVVKTERELFEKFIQFLGIKHYHILSGWNSENFDFPQIVKRGRKVVGDLINNLSPVGIVKEDEKEENRIHIAGISLLDYMKLYKKFSEGERVSYSLNNIAQVELEKTKLQYDGTLMNLHEKSLDEFIEYNIQDSILIEELESKLQYLATAIRLSHVGHIPYEQIFFQSRIIEGAILTQLKRKNLVVPNKKEYNEQKKDLVLGNLDNWKDLKTKIKVEKTADGYDVNLDEIEDDYIFTVGAYQFSKEELQQKLNENELQLNTRGGLKKLANTGEGAYVKEPLKGRHGWIIDLDFTSLYPSIMRSLNISPETKVAVIEDWDPLDIDNRDRFNVRNGDAVTTVSKETLLKSISDRKFLVSANGVLYSNEKRGVIPEVLDSWFSDRLRYQELSKKAFKEGKIEESKTYDTLDYITKILLNSVYGVLLSPSYRFYDKDNGEAVTITGQFLIKKAESLVNQRMNQEANTRLNLDLGYPNAGGIACIVDHQDYVLAVDTDSTLINVGKLSGFKQEEIPELAKKLQDYVNTNITPYVKEHLRLDSHFFSMKQEMIAKSGLFIEKKRYALHIIEKKGKPKDELEIKGIDVVRTNFPQYFRDRLKDVIITKILNGASKEEIEREIEDLKKGMLDQEVTEIMVPTGVKNVNKYIDPIDRYAKRTPIYSKAAINHNLLLKSLKLDVEYEPVYDGDKIKYCYIKENEYNFDVMAIKENSPQEILEFVKKFIDYDKIFQHQLISKLDNWFIALGWQNPPEPKKKRAKEEKVITRPKQKQQPQQDSWW